MFVCSLKCLIICCIYFSSAAILGFHSMMNQEQYHSSLLGKDQPKLGWNGVAKAYQPKPMPFEPPNMTDVEKSIKQVHDDEYTLTNLNFNNIPVGNWNMSDDTTKLLIYIGLVLCDFCEPYRLDIGIC